MPVANQNWVFDGSQEGNAGWKSSVPGSVIESEISGKLIYLSCCAIKESMSMESAEVEK